MTNNVIFRNGLVSDSKISGVAWVYSRGSVDDAFFSGKTAFENRCASFIRRIWRLSALQWGRRRLASDDWLVRRFYRRLWYMRAFIITVTLFLTQALAMFEGVKGVYEKIRFKNEADLARVSLSASRSAKLIELENGVKYVDVYEWRDWWLNFQTSTRRRNDSPALRTYRIEHLQLYRCRLLQRWAALVNNKRGRYKLIVSWEDKRAVCSQRDWPRNPNKSMSWTRSIIISNTLWRNSWGYGRGWSTELCPYEEENLLCGKRLTASWVAQITH